MKLKYTRVGWILLCLLGAGCVMMPAPAAEITALPTTTGIPATQGFVTPVASLTPTPPPSPSPTPLPHSTLGIVVPGNAVGWLRTGIWLQTNDVFTLQAGGTINIWPNCEETKAQAGFPDLDCLLVTQIDPNGTQAFGPAKPDYPYPGGGIAALVSRVGEDAPVFLTGLAGTFTAQADGFLQFVINDITSLNDNQGEFVVQVTIPYSLPAVSAGTSWEDTGIVLQAGDVFTITASGSINMWPNCEETKVEQGYPNTNCADMTVSPAGTALFAPGLAEYPLPGQNTMTLIGRIGNGPAFLIGEGGVFTAATSGPLLVTTNDTAHWKKDDQGIFVVTLIPPMRLAPQQDIQLEIR